MTTMVDFRNVFDCDGSLNFRTSDGECFNVKALNNGIMILEPMCGSSIQSFVKAVAGCFEEGSNLKGLKAIEFDFNEAYVTVTPENATAEKIVEQWEQKMEENCIQYEKKREEYMKTPEYAAELAEQQKKDSARKIITDEVIHVDETTEMEFKDDTASADWDKFVSINSSDGYSNGVLVYARQWAKYMQYKILQGATLIDIADSTSHDADIHGITGFMYGCAVHVLSQCWKYGEELRRWHNKEYNYDGDGVVNPAVLVCGGEPSITSKG